METKTGVSSKEKIIDRFERISRILADADALHERISRLTGSTTGETDPVDRIPLHGDSCSGNSEDCCYSDGEIDDEKNRLTYFADELSKPTLRPIFTMRPGIPAFRNDPVRRHELYQKEWAKYPAPGDDKRLPLRWKVREYMLRQDAPAKLNTVYP